MKSLMTMALVMMTTIARADMIEFGGTGGGTGFEAASGGGGVNLLLHAELTPTGRAFIYPISTYAFVARIRGDVAVSSDGSVPFLDLEFTGVGIGFDVVGLKYFNADIKRDVRVDNAASVRVTAVGFWGDSLAAMKDQGNGDVDPFVRLAVDMIGYKMAAHVADLGTFHGFNLGAVDLEAGLAARLSEGFRARVSIGGQGDLSFGGNVDGRSVSARIDGGFYTQVSLDIAELVRVYARAGINLSLDSGVDAAGSSRQLMVGAELRFK
jgi:hypothetical protein